MRGFGISVKGLGIAVAYGIVFLTLRHFAPLTLNLPIGLRLAAFMMAPPRFWPWLVLGEYGAAATWTLSAKFQHDFTWQWVMAGTFMPVLGGLLPAAVLRGMHRDLRFDVPMDTATFIGTATYAGVISALISTFVASQAGSPVHLKFDSPSLPALFTMYITGACTANLVVPPLFIVLRDLVVIRFRGVTEADFLTYFGLSSYVVLGSMFLREIPDAYLTIARCALFAPLVVITMRRGWRGAAAMMAVCCVALQITQRSNLEADLLAVQNVASAAMAGILLFASLITQQKQEALAARSQVDALTYMVRRHSTRAEAQFRHSAGLMDRMHRAVDEADQRFRDARDREEITQSWWSTMKVLRRDLRNLSDMFHPRLLEEKGLRAAIAGGPLARLLQNCSVEFDRRLEGRPSLLSHELQMSLYRLSYEATCLLMRAGTPERIRLTLRIGKTPKGSMYAALRLSAQAPNAWRPAVSVMSTGLTIEGINLVAESFDGRVDCAQNGHRITVLLFEGFGTDPLRTPENKEAAAPTVQRSGPVGVTG